MGFLTIAIDLLQPKSLANKDVNILTSSSSVTEIIASADDAPAMSLKGSASSASPHNIVFCVESSKFQSPYTSLF